MMVSNDSQHKAHDRRRRGGGEKDAVLVAYRVDRRAKKSIERKMEDDEDEWTRKHVSVWRQNGRGPVKSHYPNEEQR